MTESAHAEEPGDSGACSKLGMAAASFETRGCAASVRMTARSSESATDDPPLRRLRPAARRARDRGGADPARHGRRSSPPTSCCATPCACGFLWANEVSEYALYLMTLLTAPWLLRRGQHVRLDIVLTLVPARVAWLMEAVGDVLGFAVCVVLDPLRHRHDLRQLRGSARSPSRTWCFRNGGCWRRCRPPSRCSRSSSCSASIACWRASARAASRRRR